MLCRICALIVQIQPRKHVVYRVDLRDPARLHDLDHADQVHQGYICERHRSYRSSTGI